MKKGLNIIFRDVNGAWENHDYFEYDENTTALDFIKKYNFPS